MSLGAAASSEISNICRYLYEFSMREGAPEKQKGCKCSPRQGVKPVQLRVVTSASCAITATVDSVSVTISSSICFPFFVVDARHLRVCTRHCKGKPHVLRAWNDVVPRRPGQPVDSLGTPGAEWVEGSPWRRLA